MAFLKKTKTVAEQIEAVNLRIQELTTKRDSKTKDIQERKADVARLLASMAVSDSEEDQKSLSLARKGVERLQESYTDLEEQIRILTETRGRLETEILQARIRELPELVTKEATAFNAIFDEALLAVQILRKIQNRMMAKQDAYKSLSAEYDQCTRILGVDKPLEIGIGLGSLAKVGSPFGAAFFVAEQVDNFVASLNIYEAKIKASEDFKRENPDYAKNVQETNDKDSKPYEFRPLRDFRVFGSHRTIE